MEVTPYQLYREVDLNWVTRIPTHWSVMKISHLAKLKSGENITSLNIKPIGDYPVFGGNGLRGYYDDYTHEGEYILIGRQGALCGNINYADGHFWASEHAVVVTPDRELSTKWFGELLRGMNLGQYSVSAAQPGISVDMISKLKIPFPPLKEQQKIANFLDYKTQQIDRLIEKKKALIEKLNEQRIAVITQAVTKGIDKNVKMKPSGVDWLGDVPEHWEVVKSRFIFTFGRGLGITKANLQDDGIPCINYGEVHSKYGFEVVPEKHTLKCVSKNYLKESSISLLKNGNFIFADTSEDIEGSGNFSYLNSDTPTFAGYHTVIVRLITKDHPRFLAYIFDSLPYRYQIRKNVSGVKVFSVTQSILKNSNVWLPSIEEQKRIITHLDTLLQKIDKLTAMSKQTVKYYEEYRSSLITAAVTGKIDVRNYEISPPK